MLTIIVNFVLLSKTDNDLVRIDNLFRPKTTIFAMPFNIDIYAQTKNYFNHLNRGITNPRAELDSCQPSSLQR